MVVVKRITYDIESKSGYKIVVKVNDTVHPEGYYLHRVVSAYKVPHKSKDGMDIVAVQDDLVSDFNINSYLRLLEQEIKIRIRAYLGAKPTITKDWENLGFSLNNVKSI